MSDPDDPNRPPQDNQGPSRNMDDLYRLVHKVFQQQNTSVHRQTAITQDLLTILNSVQALTARVNSIDRRLRNPLATLLPLDVQLRSADQNPTGGTMTMTVSMTQPQPQAQQNDGQTATVVPSANVPGAVDTAKQQNNASRPTASGGIQSSTESEDPTKTGEAGSSGITQNEAVVEEPVTSLFPGSQNQPRSDAELERQLKDQELDRQPEKQPREPTSQAQDEDIYGATDGEQTRSQKTGDGKKPTPSNQQSQKGRKGSTARKATAGNVQGSRDGGTAMNDAQRKKPTGTQANSTQEPSTQSEHKKKLRDRTNIKKEGNDTNTAKPADLKPRKGSVNGKKGPGWTTEPVSNPPKHGFWPDPPKGTRGKAKKQSTNNSDQSTTDHPKKPERLERNATNVEDTVAPETGGRLDNSIRLANTDAGSDSEVVRSPVHPESVDSSESGPDSIPASGTPVKHKKRSRTTEDTPADDAEDDEIQVQPRRKRRLSETTDHGRKSKQAEEVGGKKRRRDDVLGFKFPRRG